MTCPGNPPPPAGYAVYRGTVTPALQAWAAQLIKTVSKVPYGNTWVMEDGGVSIIARKDYHTWHYQADGTLLTNICWPGITLYKPIPETSAGEAEVLNIESTTPDPTLAVYDAPPGQTNWELVAVTVGAAAIVIGGFIAILRHGVKR